MVYNETHSYKIDTLKQKITDVSDHVTFGPVSVKNLIRENHDTCLYQFHAFVSI